MITTPSGFACHPSKGGEELLHQAFLVGFEGFELLAFGGDQSIEAA